MITFYNNLDLEGQSYAAVPTVSHAGDIGDTLAALASFNALYPAGAHLVLYSAPGMVREPYSPSKVERLRSFLELQPYIRSVRYQDQPEGVVLDEWRKKKFKVRLNLADMFAEAFGVPHPNRELPWLRVDRPEPVADVVIHRSERYHGFNFPWRKIVNGYGNRLVMVGSAEEHSKFCKEFGEAPYQPTPTYLDLARVIAGAKLFIGNQSSPYWCALGLGRRTWLEQWRGRIHNCHWQRSRAVYDNRKLPVVE
jgi:hypothetical protein